MKKLLLSAALALSLAAFGQIVGPSSNGILFGQTNNIAALTTNNVTGALNLDEWEDVSVCVSFTNIITGSAVAGNSSFWFRKGDGMFYETTPSLELVVPAQA